MIHYIFATLLALAIAIAVLRIFVTESREARGAWLVALLWMFSSALHWIK